MRARTSFAAGAVLAAVLAGGCGGSGSSALTLSDAHRLADLRPVAPGWAWPAESEQPAASGAPSSDPLLVAFRRETKDFTDLGDAASEWRDEDKLAHVDVAVYRSAADAHRSLGPFNALSLGWARRTGGVLGHNEVDGLGDEAWLLRQAESGEQVTYHWRRGNMLVEAHMHCFGSCPPGLVAATRAWAERIDAEARRLT